MEGAPDLRDFAAQRDRFARGAPLGEQLLYALEVGDDETARDINNFMKTIEATRVSDGTRLPPRKLINQEGE